jgi:hypothetical protein
MGKAIPATETKHRSKNKNVFQTISNFFID